LSEAARSAPETKTAEPDAEPRWTVVIPVKPATHGKSRLVVPGIDREHLARAIALDTIEAAVAAARVIVVTDDLRTGTEAQRLGADVCPDPGHGLDAAVLAGAAMAGVDAYRAALLGDLPALRSEQLSAALHEAATLTRGVVPDADGTGTTLVTAAPGTAWASAFGAGSFARHTALGCVVLPVAAGSTLRRDVDTADDLAAASALGLGPRTAALLTR
jgi:2-phospho-L-lactate guanylyltransferase